MGTQTGPRRLEVDEKVALVVGRLLQLVDASPWFAMQVQVPGAYQRPRSHRPARFGEVAVDIRSDGHSASQTRVPLAALRYRIVGAHVQVRLHFIRPLWWGDDVDFCTSMVDESRWQAGLDTMRTALLDKLPLAWPLLSLCPGPCSLLRH